MLELAWFEEEAVDVDWEPVLELGSKFISSLMFLIVAALEDLNELCLVVSGSAFWNGERRDRGVDREPPEACCCAELCPSPESGDEMGREPDAELVRVMADDDGGMAELVRGDTTAVNWMVVAAGAVVAAAAAAVAAVAAVVAAVAAVVAAVAVVVSKPVVTTVVLATMTVGVPSEVVAVLLVDEPAAAELVVDEPAETELVVDVVLLVTVEVLPVPAPVPAAEAAPEAGAELAGGWSPPILLIILW